MGKVLHAKGMWRFERAVGSVTLAGAGYCGPVAEREHCGRWPWPGLRRMLSRRLGRPKSSLVLSLHLRSLHFPPWTSYFVDYSAVEDDHRGRSHYNFQPEGGPNYHVLRTGCWPYVKFHSSRRPVADLRLEDAFFRALKVGNLGLPCLAYGTAARFLIRHHRTVHTPHGPVRLHFLYEEDVGASF